ncbi:MAG: tol-pal system protein YbgF [Pseudomonadota bacterium]
MAACALLFAPLLALAAVPVEDQSSAVTPAAAPVASGSAAPGNNAQLFYELQQLQTELQQLRGLVEEQAHEIERLRQLQRRQYLEVDRRVAGLATGATGATAASAPQPAAPSPPSPQSSATAAPVLTGPDPHSDDERAAYNQAFELMKRQQFDASIAAFESVLREHPGGIFTPNSHYWLGQLFLIEDRLSDAKGAFNEVVGRYPAHQKVPDSLYKLGVVEHRSGNIAAALQHFDDVSKRYPDTPAAGLARSHAAELR